ncbi:MAG: glucosaminidase domain-containing protein [Bacteroidota bacterium]
MGLLLYVFTQKQIDFNISVGKEGLRTGQAIVARTTSLGASDNATETHQMGLLSVSGENTVASRGQDWHVDQLNPVDVQAYINRFERVALTEADKYGIPVAGKLAMGIYESKAGKSPVSIENNNHFGHATPNGYYPNAWTNWRAHSEFLNSEFPELTNTAFDLDRWLVNLDRSSYSSTPDYADRLRAIIEKFGLK